MGNNEHSEENRRTSVGFRVQVFTFLLVPVAVIALAYYWPSVIHAEDKTAVEALHSCETCNKCFSCLQNENDQDLFSFCQNQFTVMSCVQQTIFIYGEPNGQPCYAECGPCAKCLNNTEHFNELERLTQPYWQVSYPGLFHTQGEMDEISQSISKVRKISDAGLTNFSLCCETSSDDIPFTEKQKVDNSIWYPVWFGYKDKSKNKYQYNYNVSCGSSEKPVPVKPGLNVHKVLSVVFIILTILMVIVIIVVSVYYSRKLGFSEQGVEKTFQRCDSCNGCLKCLSPYSDTDLVGACAEYSNTFQCSSQIIYLYSRENYEQPCYSECSECQSCLQKTAFGSLQQTEYHVLEYLFRNLFHDVNYPNSPGIERFKRASLDACCQTSLTLLPYIDSYTDVSGTTWYPVWFKIPWTSPSLMYQWYDNATCVQDKPSCDNSLTCTLEAASHTFLMTTKTPSTTYGYTYSMLLLPSTTTEFKQIHLPSYCQCAN